MLQILLFFTQFIQDFSTFSAAVGLKTTEVLIWTPMVISPFRTLSFWWYIKPGCPPGKRHFSTTAKHLHTFPLLSESTQSFCGVLLQRRTGGSDSGVWGLKKMRSSWSDVVCRIQMCFSPLQHTCVCLKSRQRNLGHSFFHILQMVTDTILCFGK